MLSFQWAGNWAEAYVMRSVYVEIQWQSYCPLAAKEDWYQLLLCVNIIGFAQSCFLLKATLRQCIPYMVTTTQECTILLKDTTSWSHILQWDMNITRCIVYGSNTGSHLLICSTGGLHNFHVCAYQYNNIAVSYSAMASWKNDWFWGSRLQGSLAKNLNGVPMLR